jgi:aspartate 1-decarboxylase
MLLTMLQAKLHRVRVTHANLNYEGSCGIDTDLLDASGIREFQYIEIYNVCNGERFSTYVIAAPAGSGEVSLNGAAARKAVVGDLLIIATYCAIAATELERYRPVIVLVDEHNWARESRDPPLGSKRLPDQFKISADPDGHF